MPQLIVQLSSPDLLTEIGVGGVLALLILDRVFSFLRSRRVPSPASRELSPSEVKALLSGMEYLVRWHQSEDPSTGIARAYFPMAEWRRMEQQLKELKEAVESCRKILDRLSERGR